MSVILDALKKAQDERRRAGSRPNEGDEFPRARRMGRLYILFGLSIVLLATIFSVPGLRQILRFDARMGGTPPAVQKPPSVATPADYPNAPKPDGQKMAGLGRQETPLEQAGAPKRSSQTRQLPKGSLAPSVQVPAGGMQGPLSNAILSVPETKSPSSFDAQSQQSIIVKTTDGEQNERK